MSEITETATKLRWALPDLGQRVMEGQWTYCMDLIDRLVDLAIGGKEAVDNAATGSETGTSIR